MRLAVKTEVTAWLVGSQVKIQLPVGSIVVKKNDTDTAEVETPPEYCGQVIRLAPEHKNQLVPETKYKAAQEFKESIRRCLNKITNDFDMLPRLDSGSQFHTLRDLGPLSDYVKPEFNAKAWIHHMNLEIPHPSLSVEQAVFPDKSRHLVLMLSHTW
jgi:hypothetical protein